MTDSPTVLPCADLLAEFLVPSGILVTDPATRRAIATVPDHGEATIEAAIARADAALPAWRARTAKDRGEILRRWYELMLSRADDLAALMTAEQGKPLAEAKIEVEYGASFLDWFAAEGQRVYGEVIPAQDGNKRIVTIHQPVGVAAAITPWNFPIAMITRKVGPALAAGCTIIVKPAANTPLCAYAITALAYQAGLPRDCLAIVTSSNSAAVGEQLCASKTVRKLSFTGSTPVGAKLMALCSPTLKRLSLELGGNAPLIIFEDADLDLAVKGAIAAKFRNSGQTCICANRILVEDAVYDAFMRKFEIAVKALQVGPGTEPGVNIGPLIDDKAVEKVRRIARDAIDKGGKLVGALSVDGLPDQFVAPAIIADATPEMECAQEEIFGPLAPVFRFKGEEEAIKLANDTPFGLASYFFAKDISRVWRVAEALEYGMVGINETAISTAVAPFGGIKESGFGREGSRHGIEEYLELKYLCFGQIG
jgi:succinate-semialdehyde dehydrogenase/glutarate-semialdehyde dehydrogenase